MRRMKRRRAGSLAKVAELAMAAPGLTPIHKRVTANARRLGRINKR
jgi:hypothetical protein